MDFYISLFFTIFLVCSTNFIILAKGDVQSTKELQNSPTKTTLPRCGNTFNYDNGGIFYKPFESVLPNERCTWIIGVPTALGYTITIEYLGYPTNQPDSGQELVITGAQWNPSTTPPVLTSYRPTSTESFNVANANIEIVTFYTCDLEITNNTGFALKYQAIYEGDITRTSNISTHYIFESPTFDFYYGGIYRSTELAAFVFPPRQHVCSSDQNHVLYKVGVMEGDDCASSIHVYSLDVCPTSPGSGIWKANGRICNDVTTKQIANDDITLMLFSSDPDEASYWFYFSYTAC